MNAGTFWLRLSSRLLGRDAGHHDIGRPGEGRVLVATRLDANGEPSEWTWVEPDAIAQYDARNWRDVGVREW